MKRTLVLLLCAGTALAAAASDSHSKPSAARARAPQSSAQPTAITPMQPSQAQALTTAAEDAEANMPAPALPAAVATPLADVVPVAHHSAPALAPLPVGTAVWMKLETALSTRTNKAGDRFSGRVTRDVMLNGRKMIPVGAALEGRIAHVTEPRRIKGLPTLDLRPELVTLPNGDRLLLNAVVVDTNPHSQTTVNDEGRIKGRGHDGGDWKETGIAAGAGAATGGIVAGGVGALVGAGVGATASTVHWLVKKRSADVPAGTEIIMELSRPMTITNDAVGN